MRTFLLLFLFSGYAIFAQQEIQRNTYFGVGFGANHCSVGGSDKTYLKGDLGYSARLYFGKAIWKDVLFIQPEIGYLKINASSPTYWLPFIGTFKGDERLHLHFIEGALLMRWRMAESFCPFAGAAFRKYTKGSMRIEAENGSLQDTKPSRTDWAIPVGFCWISEGGLSIEMRYAFGLTSIASHSSIKTNVLFFEIILTNFRIAK